MQRLLAAAALLFVSQVQALDWKDSPAVAQLFAEAQVKGTFVLYDAQTEQLTGHDRARAETRFIPASTFKIPNSLIGLSTGAVSSVDEVLPYGGKPQPFKAWEKDMGLREAIKASSVPVYQELARRIGLERMSVNVANLGFGNGEIGSVVDNFWLVGPLKISAVEQTQFLTRLARQQLPFPPQAQAQVRELVQLERGEGWTLYGKTGWATTYTPKLGWWVGWVEQNGKLYSFALNMDMAQLSEAPKRIELGKASLKALGLL